MPTSRDKKDSKTIEHVERLAQLARVVFGGTYGESRPLPQPHHGERRSILRP
ncbi:MAG: hypothetical protein KDI82_09875 [Gammaproteobacteria bacterium]|nr:hypothetical protein [Gammaproteobacteria bacterium]